MELQELLDQLPQHQKDVQKLMEGYIADLGKRMLMHDYTKELPGAAELLLDCLNGDREWQDWNDYHFKAEDHHPEYYTTYKEVPITEMPMTAMLEMVCDGAAACYRRNPNVPTYEEQKKFYWDKGFNEPMSEMLAREFMISYNRLKDME